MKRLFFVVVAAVAMLATSCSKDDTSTVVGGEKSTVTFAVAAPELATRAEYGDGYTATHLTWGVYDATGNYLENLSAEGLVGVDFPTGSLSTSVKIDLVNGKEYKVIFWAGAEGAPYAVDFETKKMTVNDVLVANAEAYDAFYKYQEVATVNGARTETIELTRPFAQLNIATADTQKAADGGLVVKQTKVVVPVYGTLNLKDGSVADRYTRTFAMADILSGETISVGGKSYDLLSMNYLLVNTKEIQDVVFTVANGTFEQEYTYHNVPLQRNYKTNIIGNILTSTLDFEITIDPIFSSEMDYDGETGAVVVNVATMAELQDALDKAKGNTTIKFEQDITPEATRAALASVVATQKEGVNIIIDGNGKKFDGTFYIYGQARNTGKETLTFKNINFEHAAGALDFISCNTTDSEKRYAHNVTIEDCTFTGNTNGDVVGMRWRQCFNIVVKNVKATNMHSLMWATGSTTIDIEGAELVNCKNGISVGTSTNVSVKNYSIDGGIYGLRADGSVSTTLTVADCDITADQPIVVRYLTAAYNLVLEGENILTTTEKYQIVLTAGKDDAAYVTPTGDYTLTGADEFSVFYQDVVVVSDSNELNEALAEAADNYVVELGAGEYTLPSVAGKSIHLIGAEDGVVLNILGAKPNPANVKLENVTVKHSNANYTGFQHTNSEHYKDCVIEGQPFLYGENVVFSGCTFVQTSSDAYNVWTYGAKNVTFNECVFNSAGKSVLIYKEAGIGEQTVTFNTCTLNASTPVEGKAAIEIDSSFPNGNAGHYTVNINNTTANGFALGSVSFNSLWNEKKGDNCTVKVNGVEQPKTAVSSVETLKAAIAANAKVITIMDGVYEGEFDLTGKTTKLVAAGDNVVIKGMVWLDVCDVVLEGLTLTNPNGVQHPNPQNSQYYTTVNNQYPCVGAYNNAKVLMKNCTFDLVGPTVYGFYGYAHDEPVFDGCTFNCNKIRPIASNGPSMTVTGCTFNDQYHYSVRIFENSEAKQKVVFTNNVIQGSNDKGEFEGINISKKGGSATVTADFTIKGNTAVKYRHHKNVTMSDACTYDTDIANFAFEREE